MLDHHHKSGKTNFNGKKEQEKKNFRFLLVYSSQLMNCSPFPISKKFVPLNFNGFWGKGIKASAEVHPLTPWLICRNVLFLFLLLFFFLKFFFGSATVTATILTNTTIVPGFEPYQPLRSSFLSSPHQTFLRTYLYDFRPIRRPLSRSKP